MTDKFKKDRKLSPELHRIAREKGTEIPFTGKYWNSHEKGMYTCAVCGADLFSSDAKFDSGTGWPSFTEPANRDYVELKEDISHGMIRTEVTCKSCGAHLGHVFDDVPTEIKTKAGKKAKRYCVNSLCLDLKQKD